MYKLLLAALLCIVTTKGAVAVDEVKLLDRQVRWEGTTDLDMLHQVQKDLDQAVKDHVQVLRVSISSPGGPLLTSLEIAKLIRDTHDKTGLIVEIHASMLCASGCTIVLSSGSLGYRYINKETLFLVHSMQSDGSCVTYIPNPSSQEDKATDRLFEMMRAAYVRYTYRSLDEVTDWTTCGKELVGGGDLAVAMSIADRAV